MVHHLLAMCKLHYQIKVKHQVTNTCCLAICLNELYDIKDAASWSQFVHNIYLCNSISWCVYCFGPVRRESPLKVLILKVYYMDRTNY